MTNQLIRIQKTAKHEICIKKQPAVLTASVGQQLNIFHCPAQRKYVPTASGNRDFISSPAHLHIRLANDLNSKIRYMAKYWSLNCMVTLEKIVELQTIH